MINLINKLKQHSIILIILAILSLTWLVILYFLTTDIFSKNEISLTYEWLLFYIGIVAILLFHIWVFVLIYFSFRIVFKFKYEEKKELKEED
jgi:hypothetical protein